MNALTDSLTIAILLTLIFGAVAFYLWSRITRTETRLTFLESVLLDIKLRTEGELSGPDLVEAIGSPAPLREEDVDSIDEEEYADLLKEIPSSSSSTHSSKASTLTQDLTEAAGAVKEESELPSELASELVSASSSSALRLDVNYEAMTVKELTALAKERGLRGIPQRRSELISALKQTGAPPSAPVPIEMDAAEISEDGFTVDLQKN